MWFFRIINFLQVINNIVSLGLFSPWSVILSLSIEFSDAQFHNFHPHPHHFLILLIFSLLYLSVPYCVCAFSSYSALIFKHLCLCWLSLQLLWSWKVCYGGFWIKPSGRSITYKGEFWIYEARYNIWWIILFFTSFCLCLISSVWCNYHYIKIAGVFTRSLVSTVFAHSFYGAEIFLAVRYFYLLS